MSHESMPRFYGLVKFVRRTLSTISLSLLSFTIFSLIFSSTLALPFGIATAVSLVFTLFVSYQEFCMEEDIAARGSREKLFKEVIDPLRLVLSVVSQRLQTSQGLNEYERETVSRTLHRVHEHLTAEEKEEEATAISRCIGSIPEVTGGLPALLSFHVALKDADKLFPVAIGDEAESED
jgi:hypothetical protein